MKKTILTILVSFSLTITACGNAQANSTQESTYLPATTELAIGTLKLEDTAQVVTSDQAKELLVMWQVYQSLCDSDTVAQAEIDGLVEQIQGTMTSEQAKAISDMKLTQQDVFNLIQEQGVGRGLPQQSSSGSNTTQGSEGFAPPDGGMAGGAPPDGGMGGDLGGMGGAGPGSSTDQNLEAGDSAGIPVTLVAALIQYLEQKAGF